MQRVATYAAAVAIATLSSFAHAEVRVTGSADALLNISYTDRLVGQADALAVIGGVGWFVRAERRAGALELRATLRSAFAWAYTRASSEVVKTGDVTRLDALALAWWRRPWGAFARVDVLTHVLPAEDVRPAPFGYVVGDPPRQVPGRRLALAEAFEPLTAIVSAGVAHELWQRPHARVLIGAGVGARGTAVRGTARVVDDDKATPTIEVREIGDIAQLGALLWFELSRGAPRDRIQLELELALLAPAWTNDDRGRSALQLPRVASLATVELRLLPRLALAPRLAVIVDRQVLDAAQVQFMWMLRAQLGER